MENFFLDTFEFNMTIFCNETNQLPVNQQPVNPQILSSVTFHTKLRRVWVAAQIRSHFPAAAANNNAQINFRSQVFSPAILAISEFFRKSDLL